MGRYRREGVMRKSKRARLKAAGWVVGSVKEFLGLSETEAVLIEMKLARSQSLRDRRKKQGLSQVPAYRTTPIQPISSGQNGSR